MSISIMGLYEYDPSILDAIIVPDGIDHDILNANILMECAELETYIPDPNILKQSLAFWSAKNADNWQKLKDVLEEEYNPLWNKDGTFIEERNLESSGTSIGAVSAFNAEGFQNANKNDASGLDHETITRTERGNIGVTTSQAMLNEEVDIRRNINIYDIIVEDFKSRFCIYVY